MKCLASIYPEDVDAKAPKFDYATFTPRSAVRAIVLDGDKVALVHVSAHNYYMLPGGGIEDEDVATALVREIMEEIGCKIEIDREIGSIDVYCDRWQQKQTDVCYTAHKLAETQATSLVDFEKAEGLQTVWADNLKEAMRLVREAEPKERDGRLVRARDLLFLETLATSF